MSTSPRILRQARLSAGLSQSELADRSGIAQSSISAYERGRHVPSIEVLRRLVEATGSSLVIQLAPRTSQEASSPAASVLEVIRTRRDELIRAAGEFGASNLRVFGSVARGEERPGSDVDLLVDLEKPVGLIGLARIEDALGTIVGRRVEVLPTYTLDSESRQEVLRGAVPL